MEATIGLILKRISRISYVVGSICLLAGLILSYVNIPASAAEPNLQEDEAPEVMEEPACTPPKDWDLTTRFNRQNPSKEWQFDVEEPQMDVTLEFIYYQDYDPEGCPFDCVNTDECQDYETGDVESPFGSFSIEDGKEGADGGVETQSGVLSQGSYTAKFTFTGGRDGPLKGSINVGLKVKKSSVEAETPTPTDVPPMTETPTPTAILTETPTATAILTETPTGTVSASTITVTPGSPEPSDTPTPTATGTLPTQTPTETGTPIVKPPGPSPTPTDVERTPPATLSPPTPPPGALKTPAIIPVTGLDLTYADSKSFLSQNQFLNLGIGFLGLGLVFHGISRKFNKR
jgi:hypothetical protein